MAKVSILSLLLLVLMGSVACQDYNGAPSASPPSYTAPSPRPSNYMKRIRPMHPPSSNAPAYPSPGPSPTSSSAAPPSYPMASSSSPSPSSSSVAPAAYPMTSSPSPSPSSSFIAVPAYPVASSPSPSSSSSSAAPPAYPLVSSPNPSPSSISAAPLAYPVASSPYPSPSSISAAPLAYPLTSSPSPNPSSSSVAPPAYTMASSPSPSPSSSYVAPPAYPTASSPSPSPSSSVPSPTANSPSPSTAPSGLRVGYYGYSCPNAEAIVRAAVQSAVDSNPGTGAGLIRLFFHDCFVQGCDASVLLNTTGSSDLTERQSPPNLTLRGFEVIDAAKAALEAACPGVVSCADVVAFAGRDATFFLSGNAVDFGMPAGRYDGRVSRSDEARANLPPPFAGLQQLEDMFAAKGLDADDMITLSGAHTVGRAHCSSFSGRIPPNNASSDAMNPTLASSLIQQCGNGGDPAVAQDVVTPNKMDSQYYWNVLNHDVLFTSDAALLASNATAGMVSDNAFTPGLWEAKFKKAMVKMGLIGVKTRAEGEIREKCWMVNQLVN